MNDLYFNSIDWANKDDDYEAESLDGIDWWYVYGEEGYYKEGICIVGNQGDKTYEVTISTELLLNMARTVVGQATGSRVKIHWQE